MPQELEIELEEWRIEGWRNDAIKQIENDQASGYPEQYIPSTTEYNMRIIILIDEIRRLRSKQS